jgi:hypothetical protein
VSDLTGILPNVPAPMYHDDAFGQTPSLSASIAHQLLTASPRHAWTNHPRLNPDFVPTSDEKFDMGTACHALLLEGLNVVEVCDFPDWRTKAAKEARELARAHGRIPLLSHQYDDVLQMYNAVAEQIAALDIDPKPFTGGKPEQTIVWSEDGVLCRARIDWTHDDLSALDDLKTTSRSANPEAWSRNLYTFGCDIQAALYLRGIYAITGASPKWRWIVVETTPPYALSVISPSAAVLTLANAKVDKALAIWRDCLARDDWPAYPRTVHIAELPPWAEPQWLEREARDEVAA